MAGSSRNWLGVVSRDHVRRALDLSIAQINHGNRAALRRMGAGDSLVYYSPRATFPKGEPLKAFTALDRIADDEVWQADEGDFKPWRRRVDYEEGAREVPIATLKDELELTSEPNWGYQLRRGLVELSDGDFALIRAAMTASR
jgi:EVE domain